jgi:hypothetical protein
MLWTMEAEEAGMTVRVSTGKVAALLQVRHVPAGLLGHCVATSFARHGFFDVTGTDDELMGPITGETASLLRAQDRYLDIFVLDDDVGCDGEFGGSGRVAFGVSGRAQVGGGSSRAVSFRQVGAYRAGTIGDDAKTLEGRYAAHACMGLAQFTQPWEVVDASLPRKVERSSAHMMMASRMT